jgi:uncharacterized membrane protein YjjP (DUF1212 family)
VTDNEPVMLKPASAVRPVFPYVDGHEHKPLMEREELRDVINLSLWAGQLMLQHGADAARVEETIHRLGTGLGCDWMDILVLPQTIVATTINNQDFRTRVRRAPARGVNMTIVAEISELSYRARTGDLDRFTLRQELHRIDGAAPNYSRWTVILAVGAACAAFCRLFGGDAVAMAVTFLAAAAAMFARQELHRQHFNPLLITTVTAFIAGVIASTITLLEPETSRMATLSAAVLLLVPGVPLVNAAEDLLRGYPVTGIARGVSGLLVSLAIALGLALALWVTGGGGL